MSAPPGFGKSTLVAEWIASQRDLSTAWLSLDSADNEPATFWSYVVAAVRTAEPDVGEAAEAALHSGEPQAERAVHALLNDLAVLSRDLLLVLDDYHVIERPEVHDEVAFVLDRLPPTVHVLVATRADPPLPLPRLRARGELVEIRAADLRFTADEAAAYLNGSMGLQLTSADVAALEGRTEGWIAALQLAALSIQGRGDAASFIASFAGDDRYIVDYLVDEVLARQPEEIRRFLLETAVLERLTAPLCDAVTGRSDGRTTLEALDRGNLFLIALDDRRRWYRYHHLFADVLRARLLDEEPGRVPELHGRASRWFEQQHDRPEAIRHALAGEDFGRAAQLIELAIPEMRRTRQEMSIRRWMEALPAAEVEARPVLAAAFAGALMQTGEFARVGALLDAAERSLRSARAEDRVIADHSELRRLPGTLGMLRAGHARISGDLPGTIAHATRALEVVDPDDHLSRGGSASLLGLAYWETGDLEAAHRSFADGMASLEKAEHISDVVGGAVTLADIRIAQGRLGDALRTYERGLEIAVSQDGPPLRGAADMHVGMSDVLRERNDVAAAAEHLAASRELGDENGLPKNPSRWRIAEARMRAAHGDIDAALELLDEAESVFFADFSPVVTPIPALAARLRIAQGQVSEARRWARTAQVSEAREVSYVGQFELATLARLLLAEGDLEAATALTDRLVASAERGGWFFAAIDALVVQALARKARGDTTGALTSLARAFEPAQPEGYVHIFIDEGRPMAALLDEAARRDVSPGYVSLLRAALTSAGRTPRRQGLIEPLSERELEVLRLLATDLSGPEIAGHLVVSLNTVRSHTKAVYAKLGVSSRRAAVHRAAELDLLTANRH